MCFFFRFVLAYIYGCVLIAIVPLLRAPFYVTFWQLSMYDINPPVARYAQEQDALKKLIDRSSQRDTNETDSEHRRSKELQNSTYQALVKEVHAQLTAHEITRERLHREKAHWFRPGTSVVLYARSIVPLTLFFSF